MAEKKGDGGGEERHSESSSLSSSARLGGGKRSRKVRGRAERQVSGRLADGRLPGPADVRVEPPPAGGENRVGRQRVAAVQLWRRLADGERDVFYQDTSVSVLLG